jgi:hypothetical protein
MLGVEERVPCGFDRSSECVVAGDGSFESEPFGPKDGLQDGMYFATVLMPYSQVQPGNVKRIIGNNGEHLSGPFINQGSIGVTVSTESEFTIGDTNARFVQQERTRELFRFLTRVRSELASMHKELVNHSPYLESENLDDMRRWGSFARQFSARIDAIRGEIDKEFPATANAARVHAVYVANDLLTVFSDTVATGRSAESATKRYQESLGDLDKFIDVIDKRFDGERVRSDFTEDGLIERKGASAVDEKAMKAAGSRIALTTQLIQGGKAGEPEAKWMRAVIADFPDTELATQAAELLKQIPQ